MIDAILPSKEKFLVVSLGTEEPVVPFLYLVPVLNWKNIEIEFVGTLEIL